MGCAWNGFQNVADPLHMSEVLRGDDVDNAPLLKQNKTRDNFNGEPRDLDLFKTHPSTESTIMVSWNVASQCPLEITREKVHVSGLPDEQRLPRTSRTHP